MGVGHTIGDVGIGLAEYMRDTEFVTDDPRFIAAFRWRRGLLGAQRFPDRQTDSYHHDKKDQPDRRTLKCFHVYFPLRQPLKLDALLLREALTI